MKFTCIIIIFLWVHMYIHYQLLCATLQFTHRKKKYVLECWSRKYFERLLNTDEILENWGDKRPWFIAAFTGGSSAIIAQPAIHVDAQTERMPRRARLPRGWSSHPNGEETLTPGEEISRSVFLRQRSHAQPLMSPGSFDLSLDKRKRLGDYRTLHFHVCHSIEQPDP